MTVALFRYERIRTTLAKAREAKKLAERLITRARVDSVHNRRIAARTVEDKAILGKLFTDIGPRFAQRPGGYTRILKLGKRFGDASEMVLLELVERKDREKKRKKKEAAASTAKEG
jgi:large subunit ribosomal protein L17